MPKKVLFNSFIGQNDIKKTLKVMISSSQIQKKQLDHVLFCGPPGLGKTTLATIIANELDAKIRYVQGPLLEKKADVLSLFGSMNKNEVIFIDEIHGINKNVEELLYSALESFVIDVVVGVEGDSKIIRMNLPKFTLIGATTQIIRLSKPFRDRFGFIARLTEYKYEEIIKILKNQPLYKKHEIKFTNDVLSLIVEVSHLVPRIAIQTFKRVIDFIIAKEMKKVDQKSITNILRTLGIYQFGLNKQQIIYLKILENNNFNKWMSIDQIAGLMLDSKKNIEQEIEPFLIKKTFILKSSRGRKLSNKGIKFISKIKNI